MKAHTAPTTTILHHPFISPDGVGLIHSVFPLPGDGSCPRTLRVRVFKAEVVLADGYQGRGYVAVEVKPCAPGTRGAGGDVRNLQRREGDLRSLGAGIRPLLLLFSHTADGPSERREDRPPAQRVSCGEAQKGITGAPL